MPSEEGKRIRATLISDDDAPELSLEVMRQDWENSALQAQLPVGTTITPVTLGGIYCEQVNQPDAVQNKQLIYIHGGGFTTGSCKTHRELAARFSLASGIPVLLVDYRLAPEHPYPAGIEDALQVYRSLLHGGVQPEQMAIGGDSAGAQMVLSTLLRLRVASEPLPAAVVLLSPWLDLGMTGESMQARAKLDPLVSHKALQSAVHHYIGNQASTDPFISPVYADLHDFPPIFIQIGDHEVLLSDATRLADKAKGAGVDMVLEVWPEMWHVWQGWAATLPEGQQAIDRIGQYLREKLSRGGTSP